MLNKTSAYIGLVVATAAGALLANSPANAQVDLPSGSHHHRYYHRSHNRNWNGNHNRPRIFIRIYIYNKNNNRAIAIARPERGRSAHRDRTWTRDPGDAGVAAPVPPAQNLGAATDRRPATVDEGVTPTSTGVDGQTAPRDNSGPGGGPRDESYSDGTPTS